MPMIQERKEAFTNFLDTLYYYLKFRKTDAQALELMLLAFQADRKKYIVRLTVLAGILHCS